MICSMILKESDQKTYLLALHITGISRADTVLFCDMTNDEFARFGIRNCEIRKFRIQGVNNQLLVNLHLL